MNAPILLGHIVKGQRDPAYIVDTEILRGKHIARKLNSDEVWGPFDTLEEAVEWGSK